MTMMEDQEALLKLRGKGDQGLLRDEKVQEIRRLIHEEIEGREGDRNCRVFCD